VFLDGPATPADRIFVKTNIMETPIRAIYNPVQKDTAIFLETLQESNGRHTLIEVEVAPHGGVGVHYHKTYAETFECLEGELKIQLGKKIFTLRPGDGQATALPNTLHRWFNTSGKKCRFRVTVTPGCRGFEESLQIAYGLARDGKVNKSGMPKLSHLGILLLLSESKLPGWQGLLEKGLLWVGKRAGKKGITDDLRERYVKI
jgi:quercetin dioxygenase-like cupin family protein